MDKTILVTEKIKNGKSLLSSLKEKHIKINDALWVYDDNDGYWKLIISSPLVKREGPLSFYKKIDRLIKDSKLQYENISVKSPDDNLIKMLRSAYEVRSRLFQDVPMNDTYIYFMNTNS